MRLLCFALKFLLLAAVCLMFCPQRAVSQEKPAVKAAVPDSKIPVYDVVSIKPNKTGSGHIGIDIDDGNFNAENITAKILILNAYGLKESQLVGLPGWASSVHYDVRAKVLDPDKKIFDAMTNEQSARMLVPVLTERFHLKFHRETKVLSVYELVVAKGGPKFKESTVPDDKESKGANGLGAGSMSVHNTKLMATGIAMAALTSQLSTSLHRVVVDKTGLTGKYDFELEWIPDEVVAANDSTVPTLFTAVQEQLGLKLQGAKDEISTFVVDGIDAPTED